MYVRIYPNQIDITHSERYMVTLWILGCIYYKLEPNPKCYYLNPTRTQSISNVKLHFFLQNGVKEKME
ncbi:hypothetical protein YC2023_059395 [Brassica napus]